ncbi:MHS family proline/betaine transporter-like MFS transporter [Pseudomonas sp. JUb42]|jgi:MHS family proline/betaine transporter-like MFS transporter|uniref:MFS transporter n=1 Tax=Pseudomonas sp. JUb42 TaxID=2940611 RepID=UPI00216AA165|nr:MFS transporter [Pseudomonas sp. JUb42]MCS3471509.1 MHS family proline/betaine transporter-like MFS transporter [Pseudomonas sp. JUb42]
MNSISTKIPDQPVASHEQADVSTAADKRAVVAAVIGNWLEFFDFTVFAFFAVTIGKLYFPTDNETTSLLLALSTFAVGFITRPLGGLVLSTFADRRGRKAALTVTIMMMAFSTLAIAATPTYAQIGIAAPIILLIARMTQGFSQGGEFGAATSTLIERGSSLNRGFRGSWQLASQGAATVLGAGTAALLTNLLSPENMNAWGWRIPFLIGFLIAPVGLYLRNNLPDEGHTTSERGVLAELFSEHKRSLALITMMVVGGTVSVYVLSFYLSTYAIHNLGLPQKTALWISVTSGLTLLIFAPVWGAWSDRLGRRRLPMIIGKLMLIALLYPAFWLFNAYPTLYVILPLAALLGVFYAMGSSPQYSLMCESFPKRIRATAISIAYTFAVTVFGGSSQAIVTWLTLATGNNLAPAWYMSGCLCVSLFALFKLKETGGKMLD